MREMFVVPSEISSDLPRVAVPASISDHRIQGRRSAGERLGMSEGLMLLVMRQAVQQVSERFGMHVPVLDRHLQKPGIRSLKMRIDPCASLRSCIARSRAVGQSRGESSGASPGGGSMPRSNRVSNSGWKEGAFMLRRASRLQVEGFEMPQIKDQAMALGDGTRIESLGSDQMEKAVGLVAGENNLVAEGLKRRRHSGA